MNLAHCALPLTGFPVSPCQPMAAEHLKQAAKVRGLGVERQLKEALTCTSKRHCPEPLHY
ncbi:exported hypothetical protein [Pseudomonas lundensis]|uniref:Uncharacterized protein n=1 Tax=Pseudomonas lundensis TaxID=86185 RepID=A0AAX2HBS9_9PSED|nr:exported hypothetical protein [Pseudomonas lundensis]